MSEAIIVAIITGGVTISGFVFNYFSNKKKFDKIANNDTKHVELEPDGETSKKINGMAADIKGIKHYACALDGILLDKGVLTNKEAADLNNHRQQLKQ
jgi:hypothetical protein